MVFLTFEECVKKRRLRKTRVISIKKKRKLKIRVNVGERGIFGILSDNLNSVIKLKRKTRVRIGERGNFRLFS